VSFRIISDQFATVFAQGWEGGSRGNEPGDLPDVIVIKLSGYEAEIERWRLVISYSNTDVSSHFAIHFAESMPKP
jgi:hypothetical protein